MKPSGSTEAANFVSSGAFAAGAEFVSGAILPAPLGGPHHDRAVGRAAGVLERAILGGASRLTVLSGRTAAVAAGCDVLRPDIAIAPPPASHQPLIAPALVCEVLDRASCDLDLAVKVDAWRAAPSVDHAIWIDPDRGGLLHMRRRGARCVFRFYDDGVLDLDALGVVVDGMRSRMLRTPRHLRDLTNAAPTPICRSAAGGCRASPTSMIFLPGTRSSRASSGSSWPAEPSASRTCATLRPKGVAPVWRSGCCGSGRSFSRCSRRRAVLASRRCPADCWSPSGLTARSVPIWSSSSGRSAEPGAMPLDARSARGGPSMGRPDRGRPPTGGSPYGPAYGGPPIGGGPATPDTGEEGETSAPTGPIQVSNGVRFTTDPTIQPRLAAAQRKFRETVQSTDRRVASVLRGPLTLLRQIERSDRATATLASRYRTQWRRFEANERQATLERADQERIGQTRDALLADLKRTFTDACRAMVNDGRVLPLVEAMLAEEGSTVAEEHRSAWGEPGAAASERRVVGAFLSKPDAPAAETAAETPAVTDDEQPVLTEEGETEQPRQPGRHPALPPHYRVP